MSCVCVGSTAEGPVSQPADKRRTLSPDPYVKSQQAYVVIRASRREYNSEYMERFERKEASALLTLQSASEKDIDTLLELERSVSGPNTYSPTLEKEEWEEELKSGSVFLIKNGDEIVGNISYENKGPDHLYISGIAVRPEFQGRGLGTQALKQILDQHSEVSRIDLVTHPDNPALKLYESLGFTVESREENYWGEGEPRLVLVLQRGGGK
jgi:ribosomal protein S18 acetylase RimI-like enzyme